MSPLTDVRSEITKAFESGDVPKPLYAVAGVGGLAVEKLRDAEQRVRALQIEQRIAGLGDGARALPGRVQTVPDRVRELPATVVNAALSAGDRAGSVYDDLSERGKKLVDGWTAVTITDAPAKKAEQSDGTATKTAAKKTAAKTGTAKTGTKSTAAKSTGSKSTKAATGKSTTKKA